jgi:CheY-like chemotaxis protein
MKPSKLQPQHILLVDDEHAVRASTRMLLELDGHTVVEAEGGARALELLKADGFDLVITDFRMPGMDGGQLTVRIKQATPQRPVIILTAWPADVTPDIPADQILAKPYTLSDLRQTLARALVPH